MRKVSDELDTVAASEAVYEDVDVVLDDRPYVMRKSINKPVA